MTKSLISLNTFKRFFLFILLLRVFSGLRRNSFFVVWVCLELNILSFISLVVRNSVERNRLRAVVYFFPQAVSSSIFIFRVFSFDLISINTLEILLVVSIRIKLGVPPFHVWVIVLVKKLSSYRLFLMLTVQKILPFWLIIIRIKIFHWIFIFLGVILRVLGRVGQRRVLGLLGFSSIYSVCWIIRSIRYLFGLIYLRVYRVGLFLVISVLRGQRTGELESFQECGLFNYLVLLKGVMLIIGLPPFILFFVKVLILSELIFQQQQFMGVFLACSSIIFFFVYARFFMLAARGLFSLRLFNLRVRRSMKRVLILIIFGGVLPWVI